MKDYCRVHFSGLSPGIRIIVGITLLHHVVLYTQAATPSPFDGCGPGRQNILSIDELDIVLKWMPDTFKNPDDICVTQLGEGSYLCRDAYSGDYSGICRAMWCRDPSSRVCTLVDANDGVQCGNRKWCLRGECRFSDQAVATPDSCPFGDTAMTNGFGMSCPDMISRDKKLCYDTSIEQMCCQSCRAVRTYLKGCIYGDRTDGCSRAECPLMTTNGLLNCCQTCSYLVPTEVPPTTSTVPRPSQGTTRPEIETSTRMPRTDPRTTEMPGTATTTTTTATNITSTSPTSATRGSPPTTNRPQSTVSLPSASATPVQASDTTSSRSVSATTTAGPTGTTAGQASTTTSGQPGTTATTEGRTGTTAGQTPTTTSGQPGTTATTAERTGTTSAGPSDTSQPGTGITGSQQDGPNIVAMGTGIGVGAAVLVAVIVIVVYVVRKRMLTSQPLQNMASEDDHSIGGDSFSRLTADMNVTSTTWYPSYRTFTNMD
ncbi:cell wall protein DAN4-like [Haliotis rubra]|uniref:cell wall protein DAN4-like n=1 Tax=Haliotis rubra TaxID=36100 RepID=UPI001EE614DB|nr:cell wall protein DAN4-like [Haliotis rubra]